MARGASGRIVIEVDPQLKGDLYVELSKHGSTLKAWFLEEARQYIRERRQPPLFIDGQSPHNANMRPTQEIPQRGATADAQAAKDDE